MTGGDQVIRGRGTLLEGLAPPPYGGGLFAGKFQKSVADPNLILQRAGIRNYKVPLVFLHHDNECQRNKSYPPTCRSLLYLQTDGVCISELGGGGGVGRKAQTRQLAAAHASGW